MRTIQASLMAVFALAVATGDAGAGIKAELISTRMIWDRAPHNAGADLVRLKDRWFLACREGTDAYSQDGTVRVIASTDGTAWESAALIKSPTPNRGLGHPTLTITPAGRLMLSAPGIVANPNSTDPLPRFGGTVRTMAWFSADGLTWGDAEPIGVEDFPLSRVVFREGVGYGYAYGRICGVAQTVRVYAGKDPRGLEESFEETFSGFFPGDAVIFFDGDVAHCLMSRASAEIGNAPRAGFLGTARAPYTEWDWKELNTPIRHPNVVRMPDGRFVAAVGQLDGKARTSLCELDLAAGKLTEVLELPAGRSVMNVGLVVHDGHLWVSYHARRQGKTSVHLARVKLDR